MMCTWSWAAIGIALTPPLRLIRPNTMTLPAALQPRLPCPRRWFLQLNASCERLTQSLTHGTTAPHQPIEALAGLGTDRATETLAIGGNPQYEQFQQLMFVRRIQVHRIPRRDPTKSLSAATALVMSITKQIRLFRFTPRTLFHLQTRLIWSDLGGNYLNLDMPNNDSALLELVRCQ